MKKGQYDEILAALFYGLIFSRQTSFQLRLHCRNLTETIKKTRPKTSLSRKNDQSCLIRLFSCTGFLLFLIFILSISTTNEKNTAKYM